MSEKKENKEKEDSMFEFEGDEQKEINIFEYTKQTFQSIYEDRKKQSGKLYRKIKEFIEETDKGKLLFRLAFICYIILAFLIYFKNPFNIMNLSKGYGILVMVGIGAILISFGFINKNDTLKSIWNNIKLFFKLAGFIFLCIFTFSLLIKLIMRLPFISNGIQTVINTFIVIFCLCLIYLIFHNQLKSNNKVDVFTVLKKILFYIPCLIIDIIKYFKKDYENTPRVSFIIFVLLIVFIVISIIIPKIVFTQLTQDGILLLNNPVYLNEQHTLITQQDLNQKLYSSMNHKADNVIINTYNKYFSPSEEGFSSIRKLTKVGNVKKAPKEYKKCYYNNSEWDSNSNAQSCSINADCSGFCDSNSENAGKQCNKYNAITVCGTDSSCIGTNDEGSCITPGTCNYNNSFWKNEFAQSCFKDADCSGFCDNNSSVYGDKCTDDYKTLDATCGSGNKCLGANNQGSCSLKIENDPKSLLRMGNKVYDYDTNRYVDLPKKGKKNKINKSLWRKILEEDKDLAKDISNFMEDPSTLTKIARKEFYKLLNSPNTPDSVKNIHDYVNKYNKKFVETRDKMNKDEVQPYMDYHFDNHKFTYQFSLSMWIFIDDRDASTSSAYSRYTPLFSYGAKPTLLYHGAKNELIVQTTSCIRTNDGQKCTPTTAFKTNSILYQRWNHIVMNYDGANLDIFINNNLVGTAPNVVPYMDYERIVAGSENGIHGGICNVVYYDKPIPKQTIGTIYNLFKNSDPPIFKS